MNDRELERAVIQERQREIDQLQAERQARSASSERSAEPRFLTGAARVLAAVIAEPRATMRQIAQRCENTERAVALQLRSLERAGFLTRQRDGRKNRYVIDVVAARNQLHNEGAALLRATI